jgi:hypothetical protein
MIRLKGTTIPTPTKSAAVKAPTKSGTCPECDVRVHFTHSIREHELAQDWVAPLIQHVKTDAVTNRDSPLTSAKALQRFQLDSPVRRVGRILDAVEHILVEQGWPKPAAEGIAAYLVNASSGEPGEGWADNRNVKPKIARQAARDYVRELTLSVEDGH